MPSPRELRDSITGVLLGCAVGDALGLPYEGLSRRRGVRLFGQPTRYRFLLGHGMVSDDTDHTVMVAQSLLRNPTNPEAFARSLGWRLRWWLLCLPVGIGKATAKGICKLWLGWSSRNSGVFSAGNGPAMRSAILGASLDDRKQLKDWVAAGTRLTHTDPKALEGAYLVALAAWAARRGIDTPAEFYELVEQDEFGFSEEFRDRVSRVRRSLEAGESSYDFALQFNCERGISGYVYHTVPMTIHAWLSHPRDYRAAVTEIIRCGGDTDTTAAIVGAIVGSGVGESGIPQEWLTTLWEWPKTTKWMRRLAQRLSEAIQRHEPGRSVETIPPLPLLRNLLFFLVVLMHLVRRLFPRY